MRSVNVIFRDRRTLISITHETTDPANWILRQWRLSWWRKKQLLSLWFIDKAQAIRHAEMLKDQVRSGVNHRMKS